MILDRGGSTERSDFYKRMADSRKVADFLHSLEAPRQIFSADEVRELVKLREKVAAGVVTE